MSSNNTNLTLSPTYISGWYDMFRRYWNTLYNGYLLETSFTASISHTTAVSRSFIVKLKLVLTSRQQWQRKYFLLLLLLFGPGKAKYPLNSHDWFLLPQWYIHSTSKCTSQISFSYNIVYTVKSNTVSYIHTTSYVRHNLLYIIIYMKMVEWRIITLCVINWWRCSETKTT